MNLMQVQEGREYIIERIDTDDEELNAFLFSLGCYSGEPITVVARRRGSCTVSIKDALLQAQKFNREPNRENPWPCVNICTHVCR